MGGLFLLLDLFIQLLIHISMNTKIFILYFALEPHTTLFCSNCLSFIIGSSFSQLLCPLDMYATATLDVGFLVLIFFLSSHEL